MTEDRSISINEAREIAVKAANEAQELWKKQAEEDAKFYDALYDCHDYFDDLVDAEREIAYLEQELSYVLWILQEYVEDGYYDSFDENSFIFAPPSSYGSIRYRLTRIEDEEETANTDN